MLALSLLLLSAAPPPLIPRDLLLGNPERTSPTLSPDGKRLAWLAPDAKGVLQVWVRPLEADDAQAMAVTRDEKRPVRRYEWAEAPNVLLYRQDAAGDENFHLFAVDLATNNVRDLTPFQGVRVNTVHVLPKCPDQVFVTLNLRDRKAFDLHRVSLKTGAVELDTQNPGDVGDFTLDSTCFARGATALLPDGSTELRVRDNPKAPWRSLVKAGFEEQLDLLGFSLDGKGAYVTTSIGTDTDRLVEKGIKTGTERVLAQSPKSDVREVLFHPVKFHPQAVAFEVLGRPEWTVLEGVRADFEAFKSSLPGFASLVSRDRADALWVVQSTLDNGPKKFWLWNRAAKKQTLLFSSQPKLESLPLQPLEPVVVKARDGLELPGYLMRPAPGAKGSPLVLKVHGGPWAADSWGFDPTMQLFANRGYAVLKVNYRGSTGFGKRFLNAGNKQWGLKMHDDLLDAVAWAVAEGVADPKKVCIYGGSYGGYAALAGAAFTPDAFKCAVDIVGPSNLLTLLGTIPPYWAVLKGIFGARLGNLDDPSDVELLKKASPLNAAEKIRIPLLIGQGANDPRVKQAESEQIVAAMEKNGLPVTYVVYPDEGHGFARPENNTDFMGRTEQFLSEQLGGQAEPLPKEGRVAGSTGIIKVVKAKKAEAAPKK